MKTCYLCRKSTVPFLDKNGYTIIRCSSCGLEQTILEEDYQRFVKRHYSQGYFTGDPKRSAYVDYKDDKKLIVRNMRKILSRISMLKPSGRLLDVGCAFGFFIELSSTFGYDAYGFDASDFAIRHAKKNGIGERVRVATIDSVGYKQGSFDVITLLDVFEHLEDPAKNLRKLRKLLRDDGIIVIATGDTESFAARILKRRWTFYIPPQHLFFFNRRTLGILLEESGFTPQAWFRVGKWLSLRYVLHLARTTGESRLAQRLFPFVARSPLGSVPLYLPMRDNIVVIAKKSHEGTHVV